MDTGSSVYYLNPCLAFYPTCCRGLMDMLFANYMQMSYVFSHCCTLRKLPSRTCTVLGVCCGVVFTKAIYPFIPCCTSRWALPVTWPLSCSFMCVCFKTWHALSWGRFVDGLEHPLRYGSRHCAAGRLGTLLSWHVHIMHYCIQFSGTARLLRVKYSSCQAHPQNHTRILSPTSSATRKS